MDLMDTGKGNSEVSNRLAQNTYLHNSLGNFKKFSSSLQRNIALTNNKGEIGGLFVNTIKKLEKVSDTLKVKDKQNWEKFKQDYLQGQEKVLKDYGINSLSLFLIETKKHPELFLGRNSQKDVIVYLLNYIKGDDSLLNEDQRQKETSGQYENRGKGQFGQFLREVSGKIYEAMVKKFQEATDIENSKIFSDAINKRVTELGGWQVENKINEQIIIFFDLLNKKLASNNFKKGNIMISANRKKGTTTFKVPQSEVEKFFNQDLSFQDLLKRELYSHFQMKINQFYKSKSKEPQKVSGLEEFINSLINGIVASKKSTFGTLSGTLGFLGEFNMGLNLSFVLNESVKGSVSTAFTMTGAEKNKEGQESHSDIAILNSVGIQIKNYQEYRMRNFQNQRGVTIGSTNDIRIEYLLTQLATIAPETFGQFDSGVLDTFRYLLVNFIFQQKIGDNREDRTDAGGKVKIADIEGPLAFINKLIGMYTNTLLMKGLVENNQGIKNEYYILNMIAVPSYLLLDRIIMFLKTQQVSGVNPAHFFSKSLNSAATMDGIKMWNEKKAILKENLKDREDTETDKSGQPKMRYFPELMEVGKGYGESIYETATVKFRVDYNLDVLDQLVNNIQIPRGGKL